MGLLSGILVAAALQASPAWEVVTPQQGLPDAPVRSLGITKDGAVWLGLQGHGVARLAGGEMVMVTEAQGLVSNGIAHLLEDSGGRLWAVGLGGYSVLEDGQWLARSEVAGVQPRVIFSAHEEPGAGAVWLASNVGAFRLAAGSTELVSSDDGLPHQVVHAVHVDHEGTRWFACRTGLARQTAGTVEVLFADTNFRSIAGAPDGTLWFGTSRGILSWDGVTWTWHLEGRVVLPSLVARDGSVWATSEEDGLFRYVEGRWSQVQLPVELEGASVFDVVEAVDGSIWVGTSQGAARLVPRS